MNVRNPPQMVRYKEPELSVQFPSEPRAEGAVEAVESRVRFHKAALVDQFFRQELLG